MSVSAQGTIFVCELDFPDVEVLGRHRAENEDDLCDEHASFQCEDSREFDTLARTYDDYSSECDTGI